jgi:hypothetical protein
MATFIPRFELFLHLCGWAASARCYRPGTKGPAERASAANKCLRIEIVTDIASAKRKPAPLGIPPPRRSMHGPKTPFIVRADRRTGPGTSEIIPGRHSNPCSYKRDLE